MKRRSVMVAPKLGLCTRIALGDIGNCTSEPKTQAAAKVMVLGCRWMRAIRSFLMISLGKMATRRTMLGATTRQVLPPALKPSQLAPQSPTPMEVSECSPSDDALCQAFSDVLLDMEDVDAEDASDPSLCSSYVKDIYKYLRQLEQKNPVRPKYLDGQKINGYMRAVLMDWLVQVQLKFRLQQETLFLAVALTDRFLQDNLVSKKMLQLVGTTAMFIASKYEEILPPHIGDFTYITADTYTKLQIRQMEVKILQALDFGLSLPLPPHFLRRISKVSEMNFQQHCLAKYLMELSILDYDMVHLLPSKTAAAACCLALQLTGCEWTPTLQSCMSYTESDLLPVMRHIAKNVILVNKGVTMQMAIRDKYASSTNGNISTTGQLNSSCLWDLAQPLIK
ncbi:G2/mitotic-specific cyclin-B1-like [Harpia harpyja]|uniref:G2/mitotic-specific cyclin-B1-like n=1 Tax=Harpia harpyja TaxID=202280 RepID=UPI0022B0C5C6|nr:G2/mitotic-specific cyclin-B1-like [Harpia harpyja]XP_052633619.1 G2/mitotic-specific cyclin-B1-like [Harpia harpyja]